MGQMINVFILPFPETRPVSMMVRRAQLTSVAVALALTRLLRLEQCALMMETSARRMSATVQGLVRIQISHRVRNVQMKAMNVRLICVQLVTAFTTLNVWMADHVLMTAILAQRITVKLVNACTRI